MGGDAIYTLAVRLQMTATGFSTVATGAIGMLTRMAQSAASTQGAVDKLAGSLKLMAAGAALTVAGTGTLSFLKSAADHAAQLQTIMAGVQTAISGSSGQMAALQDLAVKVGLHNQMSVTDVAGIMKAETGAGITDYKSLAAMTPTIANLAEVLKMSKGMNPAESASVGTEFAHLFGAYTPALMQPLINTLGRALFISPSTPQSFLNLTSQLVGSVRPLYGTSQADRLRFQNDAITTATLESMLGQQSRGGLQIASMIARTLGGTSSRSTLQNAGLAELQRISGMSFFNKSGVFNGISNAMEILAKVAATLHDPKQTGLLFKEAFMQVGSRQAGLLADPVTIDRLALIASKLGPHGLPSLSQIQQTYNSTQQGQANQAARNFETLSTLVGVQVLPMLTKLTNVLVDLTKKAVDFVQQHPALTKLLVTLAAIGGAAAVIIGPILAVAGTLGVVSLAFGGIALGPLILGLGLVAGGIVALVTVVLHWRDIVSAATGAMGAIGSAFVNLFTSLGLLHVQKKPTTYVPPAKPGPSPYVPGKIQATGPESGNTLTLGGQIPITIHQHFNGSDHQTAQELAKHAGKEAVKAIQEHHRQQAHTSRTHSPNHPKLAPGYIIH